MTTLDDIRRIVANLPGAVESEEERIGFSVLNKGKSKGFVWAWLERTDPKRARVVNNRVLAVVVPGLAAKELLLASDPSGEKIFTEPHYNGYPAILVRLDQINPDELAPLIVEAWRCRAPRDLIRQYEATSHEDTVG